MAFDFYKAAMDDAMEESDNNMVLLTGRAQKAEAEIVRLSAALAAAQQERDTLLDAINWACGVHEEGFEPMFGGAPYWWRAPLVERAKLFYDGTSYRTARVPGDGT